MRSVSTRWAAAAGALGATVVVLAALAVAQHSRTQAAGLGPADAAALAVKYAQMGSPTGRLTSAPSAVNAQRTTLGAAAQLLDGRPLHPATKRAREQARAVWVVFLRGDISGPSIPLPPRPEAAAPAPSASRPTYTYRQMGLVLDAATGELLSLGIYPVGREVAAAAALPTVTLPARAQEIRLPVLAKPTEAPLPTLTPVGPPGQTARPQGTPAPPPRSQATATPIR